MSDKFSSIDAAIRAFREGKIVIVVDAEDRENEGDFICAAEDATPEAINFMITHGRRYACRFYQMLHVDLNYRGWWSPNSTPLGTAFTIPVDHVSARTGITAAERAVAISTILDPESSPQDFVRPGHLFPLIAKEGGVLRRGAH